MLLQRFSNKMQDVDQIVHILLLQADFPSTLRVILNLFQDLKQGISQKLLSKYVQQMLIRQLADSMTPRYLLGARD